MRYLNAFSAATNILISNSLNFDALLWGEMIRHLVNEKKLLQTNGMKLTNMVGS